MEQFICDRFYTLTHALKYLGSTKFIKDLELSDIRLVGNYTIEIIHDGESLDYTVVLRYEDK